MKKKSAYILTCLALVFFIMLTYGCNEKSGHHSVAETIKAASTAHVPSQKLEASIATPEDIVLAKMEYQGGYFWVNKRKSKISRFQCSNCHKDKKVQIRDANQVAHGEISLNHGEGNRQLSCDTCHKMDERDYLVSEEGKKIDFDHSYQLCGICHFRQKKDWIGGAHGKRVTYWAGKRVIKSCTECHSPHSPRFSKRWPKTYSRPLE